MLFMVMETFRDGNPLPAYRHLRDQGRGLPDGLEYVDSWITADLRTCFQLMRTKDASLLQQWVLHWQDAGIEFQIVPVVHSSDTREVAAPFLDRA
ncbi:MAG: DUF3303 family protein [Acetobacteraceae bacterium]|nr:DUF3303 family protein [Acetobacteraceae bacterium]